MNAIKFVVLALFAIPVAHLPAQVTTAIPSSIAIHDFSKKQARVHSILQELAQKHHVVIGIYGAVIGRDGSRVIDLEIKSGTLRDVFDAITTADPRFRWYQKGDGSVYFVNQDTPFPMMDVMVHAFDAKNPQESKIVDRLATVPEIRSWLQDHKCVISHYVVMSGQPPKPWRNFSIHARDVPLSSILDEAAAKSRTYYYNATQFTTEPCRADIGWGEVQP